jgi:hypothetical protein
MRMIVLITYTGKTLLLLLHILYLHTSVRKKKEKVTAREGQDLKVCTSRIAGSTLLIRRPKVAVDLQIAGQAAVVDFGSKQVGSPGPVAAVARLGQATARAVAVAEAEAEAEAEAVGCLGQAAAELGLVVVVVVGGAAVGAEAEAEAVCLGRAAVGAEAVGLGLAAAAAQAEAAGLAAAACFDHDVPPGSCQARLPLQAIRLQGEVAAAAAGPGEGTTTVGASPWLELEVVVDWWSWCLSA